jgi:hypothetical protein
MPAKRQYWRSTNTPLWIRTSTRNLACRREAKGANGLGALLSQASDIPSVRGERQIHQRNSSATRGSNGAVPLVRPPP